MKLNLSENIRLFRKKRRMTQEQLAEALGVTVGAVSKWEAGLSTPELTLIIAMAQFFETSVDVLLGYDWHKGSLEGAMSEIKELRNAKKFDEACEKAEAALQKYPNCFDVVFPCAILYRLRGVERREPDAHRRSLALYNHALELIEQNGDPHINEWTIKNDIAEVYVMLEKPEEAIKRFKENNADRLNDGSIGCTYSNVMKLPDEALPFLSSALSDRISELIGLMFGFSNAYELKKEYGKALDSLLWLSGVVEGLILPGKASYLDKIEVQIMTACAIISAKLNDVDGACDYLARAKRHAAEFDAAPVYDFSSIRFYENAESGTAFDGFGTSATESIIRVIEENTDVKELLTERWNTLG